ncbi:MAG: DUF1801 domain-containing protein [Ferruginibacter sp.]
MKKSIEHIPPKTVDEYINRLPEPASTTLEKMRKAIKTAVPKAIEVISYQMPIFKYNGPVAAIASFNNHCSYYTMSRSIIKLFKNDLKAYNTSGVTIQFPKDKPLPAALVKKLVLAKMAENEARVSARMAKKAVAKKQAKST